MRAWREKHITLSKKWMANMIAKKMRVLHHYPQQRHNKTAARQASCVSQCHIESLHRQWRQSPYERQHSTTTATSAYRNRNRRERTRHRYDDPMVSVESQGQDENTRVASMSNEELRELAQQAHGSKGKSARRALNRRGISVEKPKMRNKDRASKQKRERQGWSKAQMRAAKARMCVLCRRIAAKEDMFRIYKTIDSDGSPDFPIA